MGDWTNPCGGTQWRTDASGLIEVAGLGTPSYEVGSTQWNQLARTWTNFGALFEAAGSQYGVPSSWLLAVGTMETGGWSDTVDKQATIVSPAGAIGVMQIMPATARGFGHAASEMTDPVANIDVGAHLIAELGARSGGELPAICAYYNSGKLCDTSPCTKCNEWNLYEDGNYSGKVIRWNNAALLNASALPTPIGSSSSASMVFGLGFAFFGVATAYSIFKTGRISWPFRR